MPIEERDLSLLIALQEKPLAHASQLAKVVGLSTPTVITRLNALQDTKSYYSVIADLKPETIDLDIIDVLIEVEDLANVEYIEKTICYKHPFTLFRIRCFGIFNGLYIQFRIPKNSQQLLIDLLNHLRKNGRIQNYFIPEILTDALTIYTRANLSNWQANLMKWTFDWEKWFNKLDEMTTNKLMRKTEPSFLSTFDDLDIALIEELTMNARRKNTEFMHAQNWDKKSIGLPQKISRKLKFIEKNIIQQYRVFLKWEAFEIYNSFLAVCECDEDYSHKLQNLLVKQPIPFESIFKLTKKGFLWYLRCPASHFSNTSEIIWKIGKQVKFFFLDYKKSEFYGLWKGAFDSQNHCWLIELMKKEKILE